MQLLKKFEVLPRPLIVGAVVVVIMLSVITLINSGVFWGTLTFLGSAITAFAFGWVLSNPN